MKTNFVYYYTDENNHYGLLNIPGELIDVSISHRDSDDTTDFDTDRDVVLFTYVDDTSLQFNGYAYEYYLKDMNKMIVHEAPLPWKISKYEKRIKRIFFIYTMVFIRLVILSTNAQNVITLIETIKQLITDASGGANDIIIEKLNSVCDEIETYKTTHGAGFDQGDKDALDNISILFKVSSEKIDSFKEDVIEQEVKDFLNKLISNMIELLDLCKKVKKYKDSPGQSFRALVDYKNTVTTVRHLTGGSKEEILYKKYMKYKNKHKKNMKYKNKYKKILKTKGKK
jgi:hypothetical protein